MATLTKKVHRFYARALIMLIYIALSVILFKEIYDITSKVKLLNVISIQENILIFWVASLVLLSFILDVIFPKKTVRWCLIANDQIRLRRSFIEQLRLSVYDIDQIRLVEGPFFDGPSLFIFLKSGKYKQLNGEKKIDLNRLASFIQENTSGIDVRKLES